MLWAKAGLFDNKACFLEIFSRRPPMKAHICFPLFLGDVFMLLFGLKSYDKIIKSKGAYKENVWATVEVRIKDREEWWPFYRHTTVN